MRIVVTLWLCFSLVFQTFSQTHITVDQTWQADTVFVDENVVVDPGATLTIHSGTVVFFTDRNYIDVYGRLEIAGSMEDSVTMTAPDTSWTMYSSRKLFNGWGGIYAYENGVVNARYTIFEKIGHSHHPKDGYAVFGALRSEGAGTTMTFDHCRFALKRDVQQSGEGSSIQGDKSTVSIRNSVFKNNIGAGTLVSMTGSGSVNILNSSFLNNNLIGSLINVVGSYKIEVSRFEGNKVRALIYGITYHSASSIESNTFTGNLGAMDLTSVFSTIYFRNNTYINNGGQIFFWLGTSIIAGNVFLGNRYEDPYDYFGNDYPSIVRVEYSETFRSIILNNSFINNSSYALMLWSVNKYNIENNIFHNNFPTDVTPFDARYANGENRTFQNNIIKLPMPGTTNHASNPRLGSGDQGFIPMTNSPGIDNGSPDYSNYLLENDILGNPRLRGQIDIGAVEQLNSFIPLTDVSISDTALARVNLGEEVARFTTTSTFPSTDITYSLAGGNGLNNDYFSMEGDKMLLKRELTTETILRIKLRVEHVSGAWLEKFYFLTIPPVVGIAEPKPSGVRVFPNPAEKWLNVSQPAPGTRYTIISSAGIVVETGILQSGSIDISRLADGIYFLQLFSGTQADVIKFHKQQR